MIAEQLLCLLYVTFTSVLRSQQHSKDTDVKLIKKVVPWQVGLLKLQQCSLHISSAQTTINSLNAELFPLLLSVKFTAFSHLNQDAFNLTALPSVQCQHISHSSFLNWEGGKSNKFDVSLFFPCFYPGCLWLQAYTLFITFIAPLRLRRHFQKQVCVCVLQKGLTL